MNLIKNKAIKKALQDRWAELDITKYSNIIADAAERAPEMKITADRLSKWLSEYKHKGKLAGLSEIQITWLCIRWGIPVSLSIGVPQLEEGKLKYNIPPYDELSALRELKKIFPKG